ncbi:MAG: hypothetical protein AAF696_35535 [Bacteroidota bacterium]
MVHKDSLEGTDDIYVKDSLIYLKGKGIPEESNGFPYEIKGDSAYVTFYTWDEQKLNQGLSLNLDKGKYYINMYEEDHGWACMQIQMLKNKDLLIWGINPKKEEGIMKKYLGAAKESANSSNWKANPSKAQFRKFLKAGGMAELTQILKKLDEDDLPDILAYKLSESK